MHQRTLAVIMMIGTLLTGGCGVEDYNVVIKNVGTRDISHANVKYGDFQSGGGVLLPGRMAGHGHPEYPIPDTAVVEWRTGDGTQHRQDVEVKKLVSKGFKGDIVFEIADDNTVTVHTVPQKD